VCTRTFCSAWLIGSFHNVSFIYLSSLQVRCNEISVALQQDFGEFSRGATDERAITSQQNWIIKHICLLMSIPKAALAGLRQVNGTQICADIHR